MLLRKTHGGCFSWIIVESLYQTLPLFALLQHWDFAFLQGGQWVQEGPDLVPGSSKAWEVIWEEWGKEGLWGVSQFQHPGFLLWKGWRQKRQRETLWSLAKPKGCLWCLNTLLLKGVKFCCSQSGLHTDAHKGNTLWSAKNCAESKTVMFRICPIFLQG